MTGEIEHLELLVIADWGDGFLGEFERLLGEPVVEITSNVTSRGQQISPVPVCDDVFARSMTGAEIVTDFRCFPGIVDDTEAVPKRQDVLVFFVLEK